MGGYGGSKWRRSAIKRYDRLVRWIGMERFAVLNEEFETNVRRWQRDAVENTLRYEYPLTADDVVLDLGGFEGNWAAEIFARYECRLHVFEPSLSFWERIEQRFARNSKIDVHPFGLSNESKKIPLSVDADASSVLNCSGASVDVQLCDVAEVLPRLVTGEVALVKINIEGGEYELLERMLETGLVDRCRNLQIQFHTFAPRAAERMEAIQQQLARTHELTYQYRFVWENWQRRAPQATGDAFRRTSTTEAA